ncbi:RNA pyrophosphohydrolase [Lyticum sinuosum]|uniref:RNA pyrophosphohydrolase n=1 Tax=Lyticum sinuosum TaxID=1332059 RepID=A0AAE5AH41_9RICK|nr:RNA pyrophosphohydrolase [Lyticum sinuosum]MDZ5761145.1 RNA pyrophosphohydrolase [Lyticum sinuosum]
MSDLKVLNCNLNSKYKKYNHNNQYRLGVGAFIFNKEKKVLLCQRNDKIKTALQMPQGGIDANESEKEALFRELKEEIGTNDFLIIDQSKKMYKYRFPNYILRHQNYDICYMGQKQTWFLLYFAGYNQAINLLSTNKPEFSSFIWCELNEVPRCAVKFKRKMYKSLVAEFSNKIANFNIENYIN